MLGKHISVIGVGALFRNCFSGPLHIHAEFSCECVLEAPKDIFPQKFTVLLRCTENGCITTIFQQEIGEGKKLLKISNFMHTGSGSWSRKSKSPRDSSEIEQPPERLKKKFKSVKYIDGGSYGSVWAVEDQQLRKMAIKSQKYDGDEDGIPGNLIRELAALARLSHPNIVNLEKVWHGKSESSVDMMLPYFAQDLNAWIRKMEWKVRLGSMEAVFEQLLDVLCAIHENDIQHLDIKSANILVQDDKVSLCDFGLCSLDSLDAFQNVTLCSANYRPPELLARCIVEKSKKTLERVDVWSMGCVFVEYILGFHPFNRGEDAPQTLLAILRYSVPVVCQ